MPGFEEEYHLHLITFSYICNCIHDKQTVRYCTFMAFRSAIIGIVSVLSALFPTVAAACGNDRHNHSYNESYYSNDGEWNEPYYGTRPVRRTPRMTRTTPMRGNGTDMQGFHCYYKDKNGTCMNYSYRHAQQWNQWDDGIYPPTVDPFVAAPYGHEYSGGYYNQWNDPYEYSPYGW